MANDLETRMRNALESSVEMWAARGFILITNAVKDNLTGKVLKTRSGRLRDSIGAVSRIQKNGFTVGTNVSYGIGWEKGFTRPKNTIVIRPTTKKALKFRLRSGQVIVRRRVVQRPKKYAARPFIEPAISRNEQRLVKILGESLLEEFGKIPAMTVDVRIL